MCPYGEGGFRNNCTISSVTDSITIDKDKTLALDAVVALQENGGKLIFTDASARDAKVGAAVVMPSHVNRVRRT